MDFSVWHFWVIVAIILFIIEIYTPAFLAACVGIGCLLASLVSAMDYGIKAQLLSLSIGILISFFGVRPFMLKFGHRKSKHIKTNAEALVGKIGRVIETVDNFNNKGRAIVEGDDWKVESYRDEIIQEGERVQVLEVNSTILIVKPIKK